ncbi:MAG TPA: hypothetical protein VNQ76_00290 [Planctomicrobium sp.]|nr:hypothetical protein [Planctomicrobium sp.]
MSEQEKSIIDDSTLNDSTLIVSRIRFIGCVFLATGALALTVANAIGESALRSLLLGMLAVMFLLGGGLMGLLATQHFTQTHLPEESLNETARKRELLEELRVEQELRKSKGFLGLFTISSDSRSIR